MQREAGRGGDVLTAGGEDEDSGRPNWFSEDLECLSSQNTHTHKQNVPTSVMAGRQAGAEEDGQKFSQPAEGLMASGGLGAAPLHYPKVVKSISLNYINRAEISSFYGNKCESFRTMARQVLNIAVRVMCHCQTDM